MASIGSVVIQFKADADKAVRDIGKITRSLGDVDSQAKGASTTLKKMGKGAAVGVAAVAGVGFVAADAFLDMAKAAYSDAQAQDKLERTIDRVKGVTTKAAEATGAWIDRMELLTLISDDDLRNALARLTPVTEDLGEAQKLAALAADAAVASGKPYAAVVEAMAKAAAGNTAALKKMFPQLDAGPDKVLTMKEAVDQLTGSYEGAAEAAADNDLFGRLGKAFGQIKEAVGGIALPALEELADWFADPKNVDKIQEWIDKVNEWATTVGEDLLGKLRDFTAWLKSSEGKQAVREFTGNVKSMADAFVNLADAIDDLVGPLLDLKKATDWLPSNIVIRMLGGGGFAPGGGEPAPRRGGGGGFSPTSAPKSAPISIVINNPKPEKASTSIAAGQRLARSTGRGD